MRDQFTKISRLEEKAKNVERSLQLEAKSKPQTQTKHSSKHSSAKVYECSADSSQSTSDSSDETSQGDSGEDEILAIQKLVKDLKKITRKGKFIKDGKGKTSFLKSETKTDSSKLTCFKCKKLGHGFRQCPDTSEKFFCFTCGQEDVITPKCPKCNPKNEKADSQTRESTKPQ